MASARLQGGVPRFVGGGAVTVWSADGRLAPPGGSLIEELPVAADRVELVGRPVNEGLGDWLASVGESWSQLTFFLFDPDSWR